MQGAALRTGWLLSGAAKGIRESACWCVEINFDHPNHAGLGADEPALVRGRGQQRRRVCQGGGI